MEKSSDLEAARIRLFERLRREIKDERVIAAMESVPRERFVPESYWEEAYRDIPLPIGKEQTVSQPFIIALMTKALELTGKEKVLEVGTGSGYQAAILSLLAQRIITVERHQELVDGAKRLLKSLKYANVEVHLAEDELGWKSEAPYDAIIVTAASPQVPRQLVNQLVMGGKMVIPVGPRHTQSLLKITRTKLMMNTVDLGGCRFVPLIGDGAWEEF